MCVVLKLQHAGLGRGYYPCKMQMLMQKKKKNASAHMVLTKAFDDAVGRSGWLRCGK